MSNPQPAPDWTIGPPKWAAAVILATFASLALLWSLATGRDASRATASESPANSSAAAPSATSLSRIIDLNTAPASELELLPGIGPALAARIVEDRTTRGPFTSVEDLARVHGIGPRLLERIRPHATASATPAPAQPPIP